MGYHSNVLIRSFQKNKTGIAIMTGSAVLTAFGQYLWKFSGGSRLLPMFAGFVLYGMGALLMITAFRFGSFSVLHPVQSLSYVFALLIGYFLLNEAISPEKVAGLALILFGVTMIGVGDE